MQYSASKRPDTPFPDEVRRFVESAPWKFAKTYAATWPHEWDARQAREAAQFGEGSKSYEPMFDKKMTRCVLLSSPRT